MRRIDTILFLIIVTVGASSCVKFYDPEIHAQDANKYVVNGQITDEDGHQKVNVSMTSSISDPKYIPVTGCTVTINDHHGNNFLMSDAGKGDYLTTIDSSFLISGDSFKVQVMTPSGDILESDYDNFPHGPEMDSVYFLREDQDGNIPNRPELTLKGIQFYIDLKGTDTDSRFYRWEEIETWEYHSDYPLEWYYDGEVHHVSPPDYSRKVCWSTRKIPNVFTLSTDNLAENKYLNFPLHFVTNQSSRLAYGYSLLIKQFALSEAGYNYWDQLRINSDQPGGLYEKQPLSIKGNMHNLTHPENEVLGFFGAASVKARRIFVQNVPDLTIEFETYCNFFPLRIGLKEITPSEYPAYLFGNEEGYSLTVMSPECVNCLLLGGTNVKPIFWPF